MRTNRCDTETQCVHINAHNEGFAEDAAAPMFMLWQDSSISPSYPSPTNHFQTLSGKWQAVRSISEADGGGYMVGAFAKSLVGDETLGEGAQQCYEAKSAANQPSTSSSPL